MRQTLSLVEASKATDISWAPAPIQQSPISAKSLYSRWRCWRHLRETILHFSPVPSSSGQPTTVATSRSAAYPCIISSDRRFRVGEAILFGGRLNFPCKYLEKLVGLPVYLPLYNRSGLNCRIEKGGIVHRGDVVEPLSDS